MRKRFSTQQAALPASEGYRPTAIAARARTLATPAALADPAATLASVADALLADLVATIPTARRVALTVRSEFGDVDLARAGGLGGMATDAETPEPILLSVVHLGIACGTLAIDYARPYRAMAEDRHFAELLALSLPAALDRERARRAEHRFEATFDRAPVGIAHVTLAGTFELVNDRFCQITGRSRAALLEGGFQSITHPDDLDADLARVAALIAGDSDRYVMEKRYLLPDAAAVWVNLTVTLVRDAAGAPDFFVSVIEDVSEVKRAHAEATRDPLTGVLNRRGLDRVAPREIDRVLARGLPVTVVYLDLDRFKAVNDRHGHAEGDRLLARTAAILADHAHAGDIVARLGGDEMAMILPGCPARRGRALVRRLKDALGAVAWSGGTGIAASFGLASATAAMPADAATLLDRADKAMLRAKSTR